MNRDSSRESILESPGVVGMEGAGPGMCLTPWAPPQARGYGRRWLWFLVQGTCIIHSLAFSKTSSPFPEAQEVASCQKDVPRMPLTLCHQGPASLGLYHHPSSHPHESLKQPNPRGQNCVPMSFQTRSPRIRKGPPSWAPRPLPFVSAALPASLVPPGHCRISELLQ